MSQRGMHNDMVTELGGNFQYAHLLHLVLENTSNVVENVYLTDYAVDLEYDSNTYLAAGTLLSISNVQESSGISVDKISAGLSGVDTSLLASFLGKSYLNQDVTIYFATIRNHTIYQTPFIKFKGEQVSYFFEETSSGEANITGEASNHFVRFDRRSGFHSAVGEHSVYYPGDTFFAASSLIDEGKLMGGGKRGDDWREVYAGNL
mgnify:FL=1